MHLNSFKPTELIIDVGAGLWKSYSKKMGSNKHLIIVAFEPNKKLYLRLNDLRKSWIKKDSTLRSKYILSNKAVHYKTQKNIDFYVVNDPVASSLSKLINDGIKKWKYPFGRTKFHVDKVDKVDSITLSDFFANNKQLKPNIDLLNIDIQGNCELVLKGISSNLYRKIKRIIVKVIDISFKLYCPQADIVDIIDCLKVHNFTLIRGIEYSRKQEQILEFINKRLINDNNKNIYPIFRLDQNGEID